MMGRAPSFGMGKLESMELPDAVAAVVSPPFEFTQNQPEEIPMSSTAKAVLPGPQVWHADMCLASLNLEMYSSI